MAAESPVVFIVGPTASGKTALAIDLAKQFKGEIICADSRTIYRHMDIGTAKPTREEQQAIPHWGLDLIEPGQRFTAADFKRYAQQKIREVRARGNVPFVVGGTGLYINAVLYDYTFDNSFDQDLRDALQSFTVEQLQNYCLKNNIALPDNAQNKRYLIRCIEKNTTSFKTDTTKMPHAYIVGIDPGDKNTFYTRIQQRTEQLFENGVVEEATKLGDIYGWDSEAMTGNIYRLIRQYVDGLLTLDALKEKSSIADRQLAKRQMTWFKRDKHIKWCSHPDAKRYIQDILSEHTSWYDENNKVIGVKDD